MFLPLSSSPSLFPRYPLHIHHCHDLFFFQITGDCAVARSRIFIYQTNSLIFCCRFRGKYGKGKRSPQFSWAFLPYLSSSAPIRKGRGALTPGAAGKGGRPLEEGMHGVPVRRLRPWAAGAAARAWGGPGEDTKSALDPSLEEGGVTVNMKNENFKQPRKRWLDDKSRTGKEHVLPTSILQPRLFSAWQTLLVCSHRILCDQSLGDRNNK